MSEVTSVNGKTGAVVLKAADVEAVATSAVGQPSGVASLNGSGQLPEGQLAGAVASSSAARSAREGYVWNGTEWEPAPLTVIGARACSSWIDVTAAPYNADPTGATNSGAAFEAAQAASKKSQEEGKVLPVFCPPGLYKTTGHSIELFTGMRWATTAPMEYQQRCVVIENTTTSIFKWPAGSSGEVKDVLVPGFCFNGSGQTKSTDFIPRQPIDGSGWTLHLAPFPRMRLQLFRSHFLWRVHCLLLGIVDDPEPRLPCADDQSRIRSRQDVQSQ